MSAAPQAPMPYRNIVLVGFMGTGKTTVGRMLSARLGLRFVDMDCVIEERQRTSIASIFAERGEPHFRALERDLVRELAGQGGLVVATGGGIVVNPDNVRDFSREGLVVCLRARPETILARVAHETHRPLLEGDEKTKRILSLLDARKELYGAIPHQVLTDGRAPEAIAAEIIALYNAGPSGSGSRAGR